MDDFFRLSLSTIIFFMQCGFAFMEAGAVRSKNTVNILLKNWLDLCIGAVVFWASGFALMNGHVDQLLLLQEVDLVRNLCRSYVKSRTH